MEAILGFLVGLFHNKPTVILIVFMIFMWCSCGYHNMRLFDSDASGIRKDRGIESFARELDNQIRQLTDFQGCGSSLIQHHDWARRRDFFDVPIHLLPFKIVFFILDKCHLMFLKSYENGKIDIIKRVVCSWILGPFCPSSLFGWW